MAPPWQFPDWGLYIPTKASVRLLGSWFPSALSHLFSLTTLSTPLCTLFQRENGGSIAGGPAIYVEPNRFSPGCFFRPFAILDSFLILPVRVRRISGRCFLSTGNPHGLGGCVFQATGDGDLYSLLKLLPF